MKYHMTVNESSSQEVIGEVAMTADETLVALLTWRRQPGNLHRPVSIIDEEGHCYVDEDRWHCNHQHKHEQFMHTIGADGYSTIQLRGEQCRIYYQKDGDGVRLLIAVYCAGLAMTDSLDDAELSLVSDMLKRRNRA